jgi:hypothetical protein
MTLSDLTVSFAHLDRDELLRDWRWLIGDRKVPILLSAIGDVFVQDLDDGAVYLLSTGAAALTRVADSIDTFWASLADRDFVLEHFVPGIVGQLRNAGVVLGPRQIYSYKIPPLHGGQYSTSNLEPNDIDVHFSLLGQTAQKVRGIPEGPPVVSVTIADN